MKSPLHRVVTNPLTSRMSMTHFFNPSFDNLVEPAKGLINEDNPPQSRITYSKTFCRLFLPTLVGPGAPWTTEQDDHLKASVSKHRFGNNKMIRWANVAKDVEDRTAAQCESRYRYLRAIKKWPVVGGEPL